MVGATLDGIEQSENGPTWDDLPGETAACITDLEGMIVQLKENIDRRKFSARQISDYLDDIRCATETADAELRFGEARISRAAMLGSRPDQCRRGLLNFGAGSTYFHVWHT